MPQTGVSSGNPLNMILDDGGDLTAMVHDRFPEMLNEIHGITEETTAGIHRLDALNKAGRLQVPAININDSATNAAAMAIILMSVSSCWGFRLFGF